MCMRFGSLSCVDALQHEYAARVLNPKLAKRLPYPVEFQQSDVAEFALSALYCDSVSSHGRYPKKLAML